MAEILFLSAILIPFSLGMAEIIHFLKIRFITKVTPKGRFTVLILDDKSAEEQIFAAKAEQAWHGREFAEKIIAVSSGLSREKFEQCKKIAEEKGIAFCSTDELWMHLK